MRKLSLVLLGIMFAFSGCTETESDTGFYEECIAIRKLHISEIRYFEGDEAQYDDMIKRQAEELEKAGCN